MVGLVIILSPSINEDFYLHTKYIASFDGINARYLPLSLVSIHISSCISYPSPSSFSGNNPIFHELFSPRVPMMYPHEPPTMQWGLTSPNKILDKVILLFLDWILHVYLDGVAIYTFFYTNLIPTRSFYDCLSSHWFLQFHLLSRMPRDPPVPPTVWSRHGPQLDHCWRCWSPWLSSHGGRDSHITYGRSKYLRLKVVQKRSHIMLAHQSYSLNCQRDPNMISMISNFYGLIEYYPILCLIPNLCQITMFLPRKLWFPMDFPIASSRSC